MHKQPKWCFYKLTILAWVSYCSVRTLSSSSSIDEPLGRAEEEEGVGEDGEGEEHHPLWLREVEEEEDRLFPSLEDEEDEPPRGIRETLEENWGAWLDGIATGVESLLIQMSMFSIGCW